MNNQIEIYTTRDNETAVEVRFDKETVWLNQAQMCELFDKNKRTISEHTRNIFKEGELIENSVVRKFRTTAADGKKYDVSYYNLDVIILSVTGLNPGVAPSSASEPRNGLKITWYRGMQLMRNAWNRNSRR
jgi:hypothetical protein